MESYPSWRYHATEDPKIVNDPAEDEALGEGWADTPAAFLEEAPEEQTEPGNNESADESAPKKRGRKKAQ